MPTMFVKQSVADYAQWKKAFDAMAPARANYGLTLQGIFRSEDGKTVFLALDFPDMERAKAFARSAVLSHGREEALKDGRVPADVWYSEDKMNVA